MTTSRGILRLEGSKESRDCERYYERYYNVDGDFLGFGYSRKSSHVGIRPKTDQAAKAGSREPPEGGLNGSARG